MKKCKQLLLTVLLGFMSVPALAQSTFPNNLRPAGVAFLGWDGVGINPGSLEIRNNFATQPINFFTAGVQMMTLSGTSGFAGIGANLLTYTPVSFLDVQSNINVNFNSVTPINVLDIGYSIGGNTVFQIPGTNNSFIGVNSGASWSTGQDNTFVGENAGNQNTIGNFNTFIGSNAGAANNSEEWNTYVGNLAGQNNNGNSNSFFGHHSGTNVGGGDNNT